jgi:iron complex outermembrane recepter protein
MMKRNDGKTIYRKFTGILTSIAFMACLGAVPAAAQEGQDAPGDTGRQAVELGVITVTAQKQEENVQEVPISISVFSDQVIEDNNIQSVTEIADFVPNMMIVDQGVSGFNTPSIRGVQASGTSMSVSAAMYVDGVPFTSAPGFEDAILDIERIEVLRGPQGTLYGKNTEIGAINIITRQPNNELKGKLSVEGGKLLSVETDDGLKGSFSANVSGPVVRDKLFFGLAGRYYQRDGFMENTITGDTPDDRENWFGRGHLRWTPNDRFDISLIASRIQYDEGGPAMQLTETGAASFGLPAPEYRKVTSNLKSENNSSSDAQSLKAAYRINDELTLTSISARRVFEHDTLFDFDFSPMTLFHSDSGSEYKKLSQELRLNYAKERLKWLVGLYYDDDSDDLYYEIDSMFPMMATTTNRSIEGDSYAAFFNITYPLFDQFNIVAGLRFENQDREMKDNATGRTIDNSWDSVTPKIAVQYLFTPSMMSFVSVAKGYRSGGFNMFASDPRYYSYDEEELWCYEIGIKSAFMDNRFVVNGSIFYLDITGMQVNESVSPVEVYLTNAAEASGLGAELELTGRITDELMLMASFGYTDLKFDDFKDVFGDYKDNQNPYAPDYTFNFGGQYRHATGFYARADLIGYGKMYLEKANMYSRDAFEMVNAKIGYETEQFDCYLYGNNIFDEEYDVVGYGGVYTVYSEPGEVGMKLVYRF